MKILGIDAALRTGFAYCENGVILGSGAETFETKRGESPGIRFFKFNKFLEAFNPLVIDVIVYEQAFHRGGAASELAAGWATRVQEYAARRSINYFPVPVQTLKKWAVGHGHAEKQEMMARASQLTGKVISDNDQADAILLALFAWENYKTGG